MRTEADPQNEGTRVRRTYFADKPNWVNSLVDWLMSFQSIRRMYWKNRLNGYIAAVDKARSPASTQEKSGSALTIPTLLALDARVGAINRSRNLDRRLNAILAKMDGSSGALAGRKPLKSKPVTVKVEDSDAAEFLKKHRKELERLFGSIGAEV